MTSLQTLRGFDLPRLFLPQELQENIVNEFVDWTPGQLKQEGCYYLIHLRSLPEGEFKNRAQEVLKCFKNKYSEFKKSPAFCTEIREFVVNRDIEAKTGVIFSGEEKETVFDEFDTIPLSLLSKINRAYKQAIESTKPEIEEVVEIFKEIEDLDPEDVQTFISIFEERSYDSVEECLEAASHSLVLPTIAGDFETFCTNMEAIRPYLSNLTDASLEAQNQMAAGILDAAIENERTEFIEKVLTLFSFQHLQLGPHLSKAVFSDSSEPLRVLLRANGELGFDQLNELLRLSSQHETPWYARVLLENTSVPEGQKKQMALYFLRHSKIGPLKELFQHLQFTEAQLRFHAQDFFKACVYNKDKKVFDFLIDSIPMLASGTHEAHEILTDGICEACRRDCLHSINWALSRFPNLPFSPKFDEVVSEPLRPFDCRPLLAIVRHYPQITLSNELISHTVTLASLQEYDFVDVIFRRYPQITLSEEHKEMIQAMPEERQRLAIQTLQGAAITYKRERVEVFLNELSAP